MTESTVTAADPLTFPWLSPEEARLAMARGTGKGVKVAVLDSGIDTGHLRLGGLRLSDSVAVEADNGRLLIFENAGSDVYGHGTAVASIIHETAPEAEIGSFRVLNAKNFSRTEIIREGVRQALDRGYHVLNCSFGCKGLAKFVMAYKEWVDEAWINGTHLVAACSNVSFTEPEWPGHFPSVITVNMATKDAEGLYYRPGSLVEFAARGEELEVPWKGGEIRVETGSSLATPFVTGLVARILSHCPGMSPPHMLDALRRCAQPWDDRFQCKPETMPAWGPPSR